MPATLREHQDAMLRILREIDRICRANGISYALFAGTLLGAVRHQGFIPWDDDVDVMMLRPDYERFLEVAQREIDSEVFFLQREFSEHWPMFFSKVRLNGTACIERYVPKDPESHLGVYVDVFPCDNLSDNALIAWLQFWASKAVIAKSLGDRGYLTDSTPKKAFMLLCSHLPQRPLTALVENRGAADSKKIHGFFGGCSKYDRAVFPREWFSDTTELPFEGSTFSVPIGFKEVLNRLYGDYETPTPESQRNCKVHAELVDLERSYEAYRGVQETMEFGGRTRSIR